MEDVDEIWSVKTVEYVAVTGSEFKLVDVTAMFKSGIPRAASNEDLTPEKLFLISDWGDKLFSALKEDARKEDEKTVFFKLDCEWSMRNDRPFEVDVDWNVTDGSKLLKNTEKDE